MGRQEKNGKILRTQFALLKKTYSNIIKIPTPLPLYFPGVSKQKNWMGV